MIRVDPPPNEYLRAPERGQHTAALLAELGYEPDAIDELRRTGAFGDTIESLPAENRGTS